MNDDTAFMGHTHVLSALGVVLAYFAFTHGLSTSVAAIVLFTLNAAGASLANDLDNTASTSKSSLGIIGDIVSAFFRAVSRVVQTALRTHRDDATPNPHRGFFHTAVAASLMGFLVYEGVQLPGTVGLVVAIAVTWVNIHMMVAGLCTSLTKKLRSRGAVGDIIAFTISASLTAILFTTFRLDTSIIGWAVGIGMLIHILGDCLTTDGAPVFWPIPIKGKMWYKIRLLPIHAGGTIENYVMAPVFAVVSVVSLVKIMGLWA